MPISDLIGSSTIFRALLDKVEMVAPVDTAVLLQGETGTGKELIARAIHEESPRHKNRFVAINCAAIPATLLESELFGYERGAFTGAQTQTIGRFQVADRGTLFLDEIADLPLELQPKLLRVLQEKQFERLGGSQTLRVNVRVIAATNRNLESMVEEHRFRADLYYRLNVFPIALPALRERRDDIPLLAEYFVKKFATEQDKEIDTIPDEVMDALERYDWPGNIRELQNVIERGVIMTTSSTLSWLTTEPLSPSLVARAHKPALCEPTRVRTLADAERAHIMGTLRQTNWVVGGPHGAAAQLGVPRTTLIAKMQRLGISNEATRRRPKEPTRPVVRVMGSASPNPRDESPAELPALEAVV